MKRKLSITLDEGLVDELDRLAEGTSRSQIIEAALAQWLSDARTRALSRDIERYYEGLSKSELTEDEDWAALGSAAIGQTWT